jgi:hypothetical protein
MTATIPEDLKHIYEHARLNPVEHSYCNIRVQMYIERIAHLELALSNLGASLEAAR